MTTLDTAVDFFFNFDSTGSMYPVIDAVRRRLEEVVTRLFVEMPNIRIGVGANGDYCDSYIYVTKHIPISNDIHQITQFIRNVERTGGGGNGGEAYEQVLKNAKTFNWRPDAVKILVMISDEPPHIPSYRDNVNRTDWRQEIRELANLNISVTTVQCLSRRDAGPYYREAPAVTGGYALTLDQFPDMVELMMAVVYQQSGLEPLERYESEVQTKGRMNRSLGRAFDTLAGRQIHQMQDRYGVIDASLDPVPPGRFQILEVGPSPQVIKAFVESNGLPFKTGRGFYEFVKREEIQEYKEVVLRDKLTGDMFTGDKAKEMIGLTPGVRQNLTPGPSTDKFDIFIQSTSFNRKLNANTRFLYEVDLTL